MDCILWGKCTNADGYGVQTYQGKTQLAHRVAFYLSKGYWPQVCRHMCDNPPCVNPEHLVDGTFKDNTLDMWSKGRAWQQKTPRTHCKRGHEFDEVNTYIDKRGYRCCRACSRWWNNRYKEV